MTNVHNDHGTFKSYIVGFILSIVLTIVPYYLVVQHALKTETTFILVVLLAIAQLFVQLYFFLHLSTKQSQRWNLMTFLFTCLVLFILVAGSLWIMWNMNYNMMEHLG
ncbi:MAG: cytochrome o ubiquinol oxidase subunit [Pseudomonadota bacterium]|jgi:cytochrome o ubiquinol oxidase operon protein cyoD|nr:cytochrome o ubiquinol oxidase subunit IV [Burkholderiales bacterium]